MDPVTEFPKVALPLVQPSHPVKRALKVACGYLACAVWPARARSLLRCRNDGQLSGLDRTMLSALLHRSERRGQLHRFTHRQLRHFWSSSAAAEFHAQMSFSFQRWFLDGNGEFVAQLMAELRRRRPVAICEVGCGNGQVADWLATQLPEVPRIVGLDLSATQIMRNRALFKQPRLSWVAGDALAWLPRHAGPGWALVSNNGVFEYFLREQLLGLFVTMAQRSTPTLISLIEPLGLEHDLDSDPGSCHYGSEHSFSHNYPVLLREAGFRILHQSELRTPTHRLLRVMAEA